MLNPTQFFRINRSIFIFLLFLGYSAQGQVDPAWLASWNEALQLKPSNLSSFYRMTSVNEPGTPLIIKGRVFTPDETPAAGVLVHAYHRDAKGYEFGKKDSEFSTWQIQGWVKTDEDGFFEFRTIKPAADHFGREGAHIHFTTISEQYGKQWAPKVFLADDPLITESQRLRSKEAGKYGWICEMQTTDGILFIECNIKQKSQKDF